MFHRCRSACASTQASAIARRSRRHALCTTWHARCGALASVPRSFTSHSAHLSTAIPLRCARARPPTAPDGRRRRRTTASRSLHLFRCPPQSCATRWLLSPLRPPLAAPAPSWLSCPSSSPLRVRVCVCAASTAAPAKARSHGHASIIHDHVLCSLYDAPAAGLLPCPPTPQVTGLLLLASCPPQPRAAA